MSNPFKAIGKAFKAVVKVVKKIAVPVLIVGAVVLTGGAAIGALPALGSVLGSIGISGTMASVLGGAISSAAIGAGVGGLTAAVTGGNIWSGIKGGALTGAIGGAAGGALGMISPNGILSDLGVGSQASHLQGLQATGTLDKFAPNAVTGRVLDGKGAELADPIGRVGTEQLPPSQAAQGGLGSRMDSVASTVNGLPTDAPLIGAPGTGAAAPVAPGVNPVTGNVQVGAPSGGGFFNSPWAPTMVGQVINGLGGALTGAADAKDARRERERLEASYNVDPNSLFQMNGTQNQGLPSAAQKYGYSANGYRYDPASGRVIPR